MSVTQLPVEVVEEIKKQSYDRFPSAIEAGYRNGYCVGAIDYATKLVAVENALTAYKKEYQINSDLLDKAIDILEKVKSRHEAGLLPDRGIYDEIKQFLDGTK